MVKMISEQQQNNINTISYAKYIIGKKKKTNENGKNELLILQWVLVAWGLLLQG
jgi:hypothetical protein